MALDTIPLYNIVTVAKSGGDYTTIQAAIDSITDASTSNRYLVYVAPGIYSERVTMTAYVDLAGAGRDLTKITSGGGSSLDASSAVLIGSQASTLRDLSVHNTGGAAHSIGIFNDSLTTYPLYIKNVYVQCDDGPGSVRGILEH